ncbi:microcompartment protein PduM [Citrobacter freundii]|uniref:microcompartment protein PduM n=1 Tax=Citrobacter europaeus TaxID=1914243 RepID=UPI000888389B|nr:MULTISPECIES: microcompartment protein PduM [Citrobacter]QLN89006.1 microcompartment protein PduM [Citrobacter freundii]QMA41778.1 microcompartment protein PduM [Citrobacter freundii]UBI14377.1 microcompartment protein PduM [Citrobacter europaeus]CAD7562150.1 Propanediol utilization protein PduM [Citrobacter europaeus]HAU5677230.1 microcompartment protein PduM [Citrobacter freundii]
MNNELLQRIIEEVVSRLKKRAESTLTLSVAQLRELDSRTVCCQYSAIHLLQVDLPLLQQIAEDCSANAPVVTIHEALACGVRLKISLHHRLLPAIPVKKLARLPLEFSDELGRIIFLHPDKLLSYADVAQLKGGVLVLRRRCVVTALAQEAVSTRNVQLIKQE